MVCPVTENQRVLDSRGPGGKDLGQGLGLRGARCWPRSGANSTFHAWGSAGSRAQPVSGAVGSNTHPHITMVIPFHWKTTVFIFPSTFWTTAI